MSEGREQGQEPECEWPILGDCNALDDPEVRAMAEAAAVDLLRLLTGNRFGVCPEAFELLVEPCRRTIPAFESSPSMLTRLRRSRSLRENWGCSCWRTGRRSSASCCADGHGGGVPSLLLPPPVHSVEAVVLDGEVLPPDSYVVYDHRELERVDGAVWPVGVPVEVSYRRGIPVPVGGRAAAGLLACEMARAITNDSACQLPKRLQSISRQGVTLALLDQFEGLDQGRTGLWPVDSWVASVNRPPLGGSVLSVDGEAVRRRRRTWVFEEPPEEPEPPEETTSR